MMLFPIGHPSALVEHLADIQIYEAHMLHRNISYENPSAVNGALREFLYP